MKAKNQARSRRSGRAAGPARPPAPSGRRRWSILGALVLAAAGLAIGAWWFWPRTARFEIGRGPDQNVLLVTIDTLRADTPSTYGGRAATPTLDALAAAGVRYDSAHAHAVMTLPSHVSILTGLYPHQHGVRDNAGYRLAASVPTVATELHAKGFAAGAFIGGFPLDSQFGLDRGFDVYDDRLGEVRGPADFAMAERRADLVVSSALAWLRQQRSRWFAWVHLYDPHSPYQPPAPFDAQYADFPYAGEVAFADASLGPLVAFARADATRPTLVIVTSDHGEGLGDHGEQTHGIFAYEATLRVPLVLAQVGGGGRPLRGGLVSAEPVQLVDLLPTILEALGLPPQENPAGRSLLSRSEDDAGDRVTYFEALSASLNRGWAPLRGVLVGREKYIDLPIPELYDLSRDPGEQANQADARADRRRVLEARLHLFGPTEAGSRQAEDAATVARLRALGYVTGTGTPGRKVYGERDDPKRLIEIDEAIHRGIQLFQSGRVGQAADVYRQIVAKRPDMPLAYLHLGFLEWEQGQFKEAIATLRTALERTGPDPELESRLGMYLAETGAIAEALPLLEAAAARPGTGIDALNLLGIGYARAGREAEAIATFQRILALDARNAMAQQNIGAALLRQGKLEAARDAFTRSLQADPNWAAAYTGLGVVERKMGRQAAAIEAWKRAVGLNPSDFDALFNLATVLLEDGQSAAARPYLDQFVRTAPPSLYGSEIARFRVLLGGLVEGRRPQEE